MAYFEQYPNTRAGMRAIKAAAVKGAMAAVTSGTKYSLESAGRWGMNKMYPRTYPAGSYLGRGRRNKRQWPKRKRTYRARRRTRRSYKRRYKPRYNRRQGKRGHWMRHHPGNVPLSRY